MKSRCVMACSGRAGSRGLSLIELMIAITLGLLLVVVIAQLFLGSRQTFATTDDVSRMQDNIRFSQILLTRTIHQAGYKSQANSITNAVFKGFPVLEAVDRKASAAAPPDNSDELTIRYQGSGTGGGGGADGTIVDCLGARVDAGMMVTNTFKIKAVLDPPRPSRMGLFCNDLEIVPNVVNMQVLFGEDMNGDLVADRYVTPGTVTTPTVPAGNTDQFLNVVSVRIALLFETPTEASRVTAEKQTYDTLGNKDKADELSFADRRIRRLVVTTITLRNRTP